MASKALVRSAKAVQRSLDGADARVEALGEVSKHRLLASQREAALLEAKRRLEPKCLRMVLMRIVMPMMMVT